MKRTGFPHKSYFAGSGDIVVALLGGGGGQNLTIPTNGILTDAAAGLFPKGANFALSGTNAGTGIYTIVLSESVKHIFHASPIVVSDGNSPTAALDAICTKITPPTGLTIKVCTPSGTLTDLGTSDLLLIRVMVADTSSLSGAS